MKFTDLQSFICISNDTNKQAQYNVNEKCDEDVEVDFTEDPCYGGCLHFFYFSVSVEQVISINYGIQALGSDSECFKLKKKKNKKTRNLLQCYGIFVILFLPSIYQAQVVSKDECD